MDALSEILHAVKLEGAVFFNAEFTAPWGFRSPPSCEVASFLGKAPRHVIIYHLLTEGRARVNVEHRAESIELVPGDIVIFPHGDPHIMFNGRPPSLVDTGSQLKEIFSQGLILSHGGGGGEPSRFVCGYLECDPELCKRFSGGLPPVFKVNIRNDSAGQWLENSIRFSAHQAGENRAGSDAVLARLSEALFVETLRRYMSELPAQQTGWLAGARDPSVGAALAHLHRSPERPWTIAALAQQVGVSRSVLAERFRHFLGEPPMTYLSRWRLQLGARLLATTSYGVARVSGEVGYESEQAFNRAFKREFGLPPARFRSRAKPAGAAAGHKDGSRLRAQRATAR
ncbi:MAG TPA: AraC family transcriptional regulator [Candidatus Acidoferrales bacterium]|nr:AraC family transcriptional regulator [Candidatus Acidoferrales bacterium]